ncbi:MAG: hypothetical protein MUF84_05015 [Anaerolineae bacterium]|jgi:hypothetical protein|nr:hypothetical protein [Anaerolineae bacterium]
MSDARAARSGSDFAAAATAVADVIEAQQAIVDKLKQIGAGLQRDLSLVPLGATRGTPAQGDASLDAAVTACRERLVFEQAVLEKLQLLRQGLVDDNGCDYTGHRGGVGG